MEILLIVLIVVAILWFVVKPRWAPKPPDTSEWTGKASQMSKQATDKASQMSKQATDKARQASKQATAKAGQMYKGWRGGFKFRSDTRELGKQFQQWVTDAALPKRTAFAGTLPAQTESFAAWLSGLSSKELEQFTERIARYCATVNFDLGWLNDAQVSHEPELKQAVEDAVLLHSLGAWRASNVQRQAQVVLTYQAWLANPKRHQKFGQELHGVLIERGLVTVPSELYLAPEKERQAQAATAIRHVAAENPAAFRLALRQLVGAPEPDPAPAAPTS